MAAVLGTSLSTAAALAAPSVDLLPHRAAYRLSLLDAEGGSGLTQVLGGLVLEWRATCDGWLSQQRLGFVAQAEQGEGFSYDVRFSSWEAKDSTRMRFNVRSYDGSTLSEEFRGQAQLEAPKGKGLAQFAVPEGDVVELPAGTVFPTEHVQDLIAAARAGEQLVTRQVFDGSGEDALTRATAVIGAPEEMAEGAGKEEMRWPVSLAYFPVSSDDSLPQFEIAFDLSEGGVLYDVTLDYGEFRLNAELEKLERLAQPDCD